MKDRTAVCKEFVPLVNFIRLGRLCPITFVMQALEWKRVPKAFWRVFLTNTKKQNEAMREQNLSKGTDREVLERVPETAVSPEERVTVPKNESAGRSVKATPVHLGDSLRKEAGTSSFFDEIYDQIDNVIGGDNPNQFLCITLPGQVLTAEDYAYDYKQNAEKGPVIESNESRLANKLFAPCRVTGADNGMTLPYQYRTALDTLTPKLNAKIAKAKNQLRELLLTPYPYEFGDGDTNTYTLQQVFYRLYDEYVAAEQKWAEKQNQKKEELRKLYPDTSPEGNDLYNDAYLQWYETVAKSETTLLNEKRAKVLSVFAPNDMDILNGVLDCGSGAELEQAREILDNVQKQTPNGGMIYPVNFNPTNWFELLSTSFNAVDLLESPAALSMRMSNLSNQRMNLSMQIDAISSLIPNDDTISGLKKEVEKCQEDLKDKQSSLIGTYGNGFKSLITTALDVASLFKDGTIPSGIIEKLAGGLQFPSGKTVQNLVDDISHVSKEASEAQTAYIDASQKLSDAMESLVESENLQNLKSTLLPMKERLENVDAQISDLQAQIQLSNVIQDTKESDDDSGSLQDVTPPEVPTGFTQILIEADSSTMNQKTSKQSSGTNSTSGVNFWFAGYSSKQEASSSCFQEVTNQEGSTIRIGMNVAKVSIEREWFNPGLFVLTKDMYNVSTSRISPSNDYTQMTDDRLAEMGKDYIFPCYPVAMLIARDISIQLTSTHESFSSFAATTEEHASRGGGFLCFSGAKSSSSFSSESGVHSESNSKSVTLKFSTPQIIGYYIQATPADKSDILDDISKQEAAAGFVTIAQFVDDYKKILDKMNKK